MNIDIIRAWKDRNYRESLSDKEQALLPQNPVGTIELTDDELKTVSGGQGPCPTGGICGGSLNAGGGGPCVHNSTCRVCAQPISSMHCNSTHIVCTKRINP